MVGQMVADFVYEICSILERENFLLPDADGVLCIPAVYPHAPPSNNREQPVKPPHVVVAIYSGEQTSATDPLTATLHIIGTVIDNAKDMQGYRDALQLLEVICHNLYSSSLVAKRYEVVYPYQFAVLDDVRYPYFAAGLAIKVELSGLAPQNPIGGHGYV